MRIEEVTGLTIEQIAEAEPGQPVKPLTPAQSRTRAQRQQKAQAKVNDARAQAQIKINAATRAATEI